MNIKPLKNRLVVRRLPVADQTEGGLFILGREYPTLGTVLAIGRGSYRKRLGTWEFDLPEVKLGLLAIGHKVQFSREAVRRNQEVEKDILILDAEQCLVGIEG